ncbi:hypothetical protein RRG08_066690 [Elysia crispata]|uniref:Uncharacterized protein n=1 Tax=Elysia crispata TaxID=231223 RepID=A0AAE0ZS65_9GAST|nr:hypothetical protein RRG08_066690 [Elysia crispata]
MSLWTSTLLVWLDEAAVTLDLVQNVVEKHSHSVTFYGTRTKAKMSSSPQEPLAAWTSQVLSYGAMTLSLAVLLKYLLTARVPENIPPFPAKPYPILGHVTYFKDGVRKQMIAWTKSCV